MCRHVDLASEWEIRESQIVASLHKFLDGHDGRPVICYDNAFDDEPDARVGHFDIDVNMIGFTLAPRSSGSGLRPD